MGSILNNPYVKILKLKGSIVDISVIAVTCAVLGIWDYRAIIAILSGIMIHSGCDIINDIYDIEIDRISKPDGAIASGQISVKNAWIYMLLLFSTALILSLTLSMILFTCFFVGIIVGGIMYSHPFFRFKDIPGVAMADMALCFALESIGIWVFTLCLTLIVLLLQLIYSYLSFPLHSLKTLRMWMGMLIHYLFYLVFAGQQKHAAFWL